MTDERALLLPEGSRLLHIGPHKTGTTSVQDAFHRARPAAEAQGVHYAGQNRQPTHAAQAAATRTKVGGERGSLRAWKLLVREVKRATGRVVISSEWFATAGERDVRLLVDDLGLDRLQVIVTLRPLQVILASQWQQFVQGGVTTPYTDWLRTIFDQPTSDMGTMFWHRHRHDQLIDRWQAVIGPERLTAVVVDDRDHAWILRIFERLTGLSEGTLALVADRANRSLTWPEVELIRALNASLASVGLESPVRHDLVLLGAASRLKDRDPAPDESRIETPGWAVDRAAEVAADIVDGIRRSGVRIVGNVEQLAVPRARATRRATRKVPRARWPEIVADAALGTLISTGLARTGKAAADVEAFSSQRLRSLLVGRLRDAATVRWRRLRSMGAPPRTGRSSSIHSPDVEVE